jgi:hypothetical protein
MSDHPKDTHGRVADETAPGVPKGSNVLCFRPRRRGGSARGLHERTRFVNLAIPSKKRSYLSLTLSQ